MKKKLTSILMILALLVTAGCSALGGRSAQQAAATPTAVPTTAAVAVVETPTPVPPTATPIPPTLIPSGAGIAEAAKQVAFTGADVDAVVGVGNWSCFPDRLDGIAINIKTAGFVVQWPLSAVDKGSKYVTGQTVPGTGAATAWLAGTLASWNECPSATQPEECHISKFGAIKRFTDRDDAVELTATSAFTAPAGWSFDREGVKYTVGQQIPSGRMTAWAPQSCTGKIW